MERMPSIFNDVLSPVTPGPSSSNTCGPYRIARLARALLGEPPRRITVRMARRGGYYDTFYSMHSHEAILAALLGQELLRCDLSTMCRQADEAGLCYDFQFVDDLPVRPSELAEMDLSGDRRTIRLTGVSLGGGEIENHPSQWKRHPAAGQAPGDDMPRPGGRPCGAGGRRCRPRAVGGSVRASVPLPPAGGSRPLPHGAGDVCLCP